jgi:hypothetical protein
MKRFPRGNEVSCEVLRHEVAAAMAIEHGVNVLLRVDKELVLMKSVAHAGEITEFR